MIKYRIMLIKILKDMIVMVKQNVTVRIEPVLLAGINDIAKNEFRTRSNVINLALQNLVDLYSENHTLIS
jgi:metal-responsive CopG/Arc/MetJ family transcriptional regulator